MKYILGLALAGVLAMVGGFALYMEAGMETSQATAVQFPPPQADAQPVVLELFTSQSCSSCPPADALAAQLAQRDDVIVISRPVTYWNRIGWEDTLSDERNTDLQRAYAQRGLDGRNGVYTPQIVIDGEAGTVGSRAMAVTQMIGNALSKERPTLSILDDSTIIVDGASATSAELVLVSVDARETVAIGSGENRDRTVTYTNSWLGEVPVGMWTGGNTSFRLPETLPAGDRHALILRQSNEGGGGAILAGRWI